LYHTTTKRNNMRTIHILTQDGQPTISFFNNDLAKIQAGIIGVDYTITSLSIRDGDENDENEELIVEPDEDNELYLVGSSTDTKHHKITYAFIRDGFSYSVDHIQIDNVSMDILGLSNELKKDINKQVGYHADERMDGMLQDREDYEG
jgi:hypothetical protein